jgi:uncharacterized membrane protein
MFQKLFVFLFIILLSLNIAGYQIERIDTKIIVRDNGVLQISDFILIKNIDKDEIITLPIVPVYDLKINSVYNDLIYKYDFYNLDVNVSTCCLVEDSINLEIIYLTDFFTSKRENIWSLNYYPIFREYVDTLNVFLPENTEILDLSVDLKNVTIKDNRFNISLESTSNLDVNYSIKYEMIENQDDFSFNYLYLILFLLILGLVIFLRIKINKSKKKINVKDKENYLLGLNENEQKIIKYVLENEGVLQKKIPTELFLPKGTISRNLKKLEDKGYVSIKRYGVNKKVFLGEVFSKR